MTDDELVARVRDLRTAGRSPKEIARILGLRPAAVTPLVRAAAIQNTAAQLEPPVVGCWINPGWSQHLTIDGHPDWPDVTVPDEGHEGIVQIVVARGDRSHRASVCCYLVDVFCLGVKNVTGPDVLDQGRLPERVRSLFTAYAELGEPVAVPLELARHLVWGAVDFARALGFEPHPEFERAAGKLGSWDASSDITFGRDGVPFYVEGPYDDAAKVIRTLSRSVGDGNFHYVAQVSFSL